MVDDTMMAYMHACMYSCTHPFEGIVLISFFEIKLGALTHLSTASQSFWARVLRGHAPKCRRLWH
jgi:hypothetical protein